MTLSELLQSNSGELFAKFSSLKSKISELLMRMYSAHPTFTGHDISHSVNVEKYMDKLLKDELKRTLNAYELFFLLCSAYLHDVGMVATTEELAEDDSSKTIRNSHHIRSRDYVQKEYEYLGLSHSEADIISRLCYAHRVVDINAEIRDTSFGVDNNIKLRLLCACLMIADELDITADRAPEIIARTVGLDNISEKHFRKHLSTLGVQFNCTDNLICIDGKAISKNDIDNIEVMHNEIVVKYNKVKNIFDEYHTSWAGVVLNLDKEDYLKHILFLKLCDDIPLDDNDISEIYGDNADSVKIIVRDSSMVGEIRKDATSNKYTLASSLKQFRKLSEMYLGSEYEMEFAKSKYANQCVTEFTIPQTEKVYNFTYDAGEKEDRRILLTASPNALKQFLENDFPKNTGVLKVNRIIDISIIQGYLIDLFKHPEIGSLETKLASETILVQIQREIPSLIHLLSALTMEVPEPADSTVVPVETTPPTEEAVPEGAHKIDLKLKEDAGVSPHLSIPNIFKASMLSGQKFTIDAKHIESFKVTDPSGKVMQDNNLMNLIVTPNKNKVNIMFARHQTIYFRMVEDMAMSNLSVYMNIDGEIDLDKYPYFAIVKQQPGTDKVFISFDVNPFISASGLLTYFKIIGRIREHLIRRICLIDDNNPDMKQEFVTPPLNTPNVSELRLRCFSAIHEKMSYLHPFNIHKFIPEPLNQSIIDYLNEKQITNEAEYNDLINKYERESRELILIRITTLDASNKCISDDLTHVLDGLVSPISINITSYQSFKEKCDIESKLLNREMDFGTLRHSPVDTVLLRDAYKEEIEKSKAIPATLDIEDNYSSDIKARSIVKLELSEVRKSLGIKYQLAHITIRPCSEYDELVFLSDYEFRQKSYDKSIDYFKQRLILAENDAQAMGMIGWLSYVLDDYVLAEEFTDKAISASNSINVGFAYYNHGLFLLEKGKYPEAIAAYEKAMSISLGEIIVQAIEDIDNLLKTKGNKVDLQQCNTIKGMLSAHNYSAKPVGRNQPCPCGSGKKFKVCCGKHRLKT